MAVYDRIKEAAKHRGLTLLQVTEKAGLGEKTLYKWKNNEPGADKLNTVASILHVSVDYLLGNTDNPNPKSVGKKQDLADEDIVLSFEGRQIPPEDLAFIRRFLRGAKDDK